MTGAKPQLAVYQDKKGNYFAVATDNKGNMVKVEGIVTAKGNGVEAMTLSQGTLRGLAAKDPAAIGSVSRRFSEPSMQLSGSNFNKELGNRLAGSYLKGFGKQVAITAALTAACATTMIGATLCMAYGAGEMQAGDPSGAAFFVAGATGGLGLAGSAAPGRAAAGGILASNPELYIASRITDLRAAIPANSRGYITMGVAVAEDANGARVVLISTSEPRGYLRPGVTLKPGEVLVRGNGHAEADIVAYAQANGLRVVSIGATRPVCASCQNAIGTTTATTATSTRR
jgi:hypothetical protein